MVSIESARLNYALYDEGLSLDDTDLITSATAYPLIIRGYQLAVQKMVERDQALMQLREDVLALRAKQVRRIITAEELERLRAKREAQ